MSGNELPSNMGKKIADALKKQSKTAVKENTADVVEETKKVSDDTFEEEISRLHNDTTETDIDTEAESFVKEPDFSVAPELDEEEKESAYDDLDMYDTPSLEVEQESEDYAPIFKMESGEISDNPDFKLNIDTEDDTEEFEMPNNINVLKRLIAQLPTGVSKQTGAQIIRQTIEALGIPMKSVLQDAQRVKECLNSSIKDCSYTIQEYKSNIRNLEKQSLSYQRQLAKLNDIIWLFVYTDKK